MLRSAFTAHPASVGETYLQHMVQALCFALRLFVAALACLVHAVFPFLCVRTGSSAIDALHARMVVNRARGAAARDAAAASTGATATTTPVGARARLAR
jgi:hypothetical protein